MRLRVIGLMLACVATGLICIHVHALTMDDPLGDVKVEWPSIELPEQDPIAGITNYPEAYLDWWDQERRTAGNTSVYTVFPGVVDRGTHYHELLESDGPAALAKAMVEAYPTKDAWRELAGGAIAVCAGTGYMKYGRGIKEKWLGIPKEKQGKGRDKKNVLPEELVQAVNPVIDEILKIDSPHAKDTAAEFLLQLFSETFGSGHCESHNGRREIESYPRELTARAAEFLGSEDPFTHAVAEWAVSTSVCNENESSGGEAWPGKTPPDWWDTWYKANPAKDQELEYVRQAVQLQMHRHGRDLLTLSEDQMRRAIAKAEWANAQLPADQAGLNLTAKKDEQGFMQSYRSMWGIQPGEKSPKVGKTRLSNWRKGTYFTDHPWARFMVDFVNVRSSADRQGEDAIPNIPNRYGAIAHPLAAKLVGEGKHGTLLTDEEKQLLMTWFDIQAPYYAVCYAWMGDGKTKTVLPYPPFEKSREYVYPNK